MPQEQPENNSMQKLKNNLKRRFPDIKFFKEGPASKPNDEKTDVVGKVGDLYVKGFTKAGKILGETELRLIELFNQFSNEENSTFSGPEILESGEIDGGFYFLMEDARKGGKEELDFSKMNIDEIMELYYKYRQTFDKFEKYSKGKTSTNSSMQRFYNFYKKYLQPRISPEFTTKSSKFINGAKTALCNVLQPAFKLAIGRKYRSLVNERISNGEKVVEKCNINIDREKINKTLDKLLSKVKRFNFEYNFGRLRTDHVFSDGEIYKFVDFDNIGYQIEGTELICVMWDNLLKATGNYDSYEDWKVKYDTWYQKLLKTYEDENLVKLLLFVKLVGTIFEDYGHLINEGNDENEKIRKGIQWNYKALQELMKE